MKKVAFIAILLIVLGVAWTFYLEHSNKRFTETIRKTATFGAASATTSEEPKASTNETIFAPDTEPSTPIESETLVEKRGTTSGKSHLDASRIVLEEQFVEQRGTLPNATERSIPSEADISLDFLVEEQRAAIETMERIITNPDNWLRGKPGEIGFIYTMSEAEAVAFEKANYILNPSPENRPEVRLRAYKETQNAQPVAPPSPEDHDIIPLKGGYTLYIPHGASTLEW